MIRREGFVVILAAAVVAAFVVSCCGGRCGKWARSKLLLLHLLLA